MTYRQFTRQAKLTRRDFCLEMLAAHREDIKAKKDETAVKNLELIFQATLEVSNQKGFQAMTMRDLSRASGISVGAMYDYFNSKESLLEMIQEAGRRIAGRVMRQAVSGAEAPPEKLAAAIRAHLYLSEAMQPWFFFSYMEARHLGKVEKQRAKEGELATERHIAEIIRAGKRQGFFADVDHRLGAAVIKAMLQDWYLKRWKYAKRRVSVERYADFVVGMAHGFCRNGLGDAGPREVRQ
ncbi:MAG: TetR/AcrR family transcriptional regulator; helix-turn-helix transcriptional regulator [Proteobacteria bacterium]|nr:TetR/AcrR family transcriptional regulator; helix-turn-helix transcriptional regulator [Pseudomonadota bacterium]